MFPDLSVMVELLREPMAEYIERKGYTQIEVTGNVFNAPDTPDDNTFYMDTPSEMADFIINAFVEMTKGESE